MTTGLLTTAIPPEQGFPVAEYRRRAAALQERMAAAGLAALLLTTEPDVGYLTGFATRFWESPTRPWFVVLPATGEPIAVVPAIGATVMRRTWVRDIRYWSSPDLVDDGVELLADALRELAPSAGRIGLPMGPETYLRMPLADFERLRATLAPRRFTDATAMVRRVREVKSEAEIDRIRGACHVADQAFARLPEIAGTGIPLDAVFRRFQIACLEAGADRVAYLAGGAGPGGYADVISPATPTALACGDVLMLDVGVVRGGYFCDFDRNVAIGRADDDVRRAHGVLSAAIEAGLAALRPGMTAAELHRVMQAAIEQAGMIDSGGRLGHGLGLQLTEWPSLMPGDETVLQEGMVLTLEPGVVVRPGRIMVQEENLVLRTDGAELLSPRAPADLPVIG
jgi:Xaa-Pro aminopeptidase